MATTTWNVMRATMVTQILAITPTRHTNIKFEKDEPRGALREWAVQAKGACTRKFAVRHLFQYQPTQITDHTTILEPHGVEVVVAYPNQWPNNDQDELGEIIEEDRIKIDAVLGYSATAYTDASTHDPIFSVEQDDDDVWFLSIEYTAVYHRSVS